MLSYGGCADRSWGEYRTPRYGIEIKSSVPVDLDKADYAWARVLACWKNQGVTVRMNPPLVGVRNDVTRRGACETFWTLSCDENKNCKMVEVWGVSFPDIGIVHVGPSLCGLQHEFAHIVEDKITGSTGRVFTKCDEY